MVALAFLTLLSLVSVIPSSAATSLGPWTETTDYGASSGSTGTGGVTVQSESCVTYQTTIVCVAGVVAGVDSSKVFYATSTSSGVGGWTETTDYGASSGSSGSGGTKSDGLSCVADGGYIYCVGGSAFDSTAQARIYLSKVYYAQLSVSGVGAWKETIDYGAPSGTSGTGGLKADPSCVAYGGYIYCVGGDLPTYNSTSKVFYAQLSSNGVGPWRETTDYGASSGSTGSGGVATRPDCVTANGYLMCIGGSVGGTGTSKVFVAALDSSGVGAWTETTDYGATSGSSGAGGVPIYGTSCVATNSTVYCFGGWDGPTNQVFEGNAPKPYNLFTKFGGDEGFWGYVYNHDCVVVPFLLGYRAACVGGNDPGVDVSAVWVAQIQGPTTTTTTTTASTSVSSSPPSTSTTVMTSPAQSSSSSGGGIPEFPLASFAIAALTAVVVVSYLLVRSRRQ